MQTTNGLVDVDRELTLPLTEGLASKVTALVMEDTSCVLSLGKRCMEEGYRFVWEQYQNPRLFDPSGKEIPLCVHSFVPYIKPIPVAPALEPVLRTWIPPPAPQLSVG